MYNGTSYSRFHRSQRCAGHGCNFLVCVSLKISKLQQFSAFFGQTVQGSHQTNILHSRSAAAAFGNTIRQSRGPAFLAELTGTRTVYCLVPRDVDHPGIDPSTQGIVTPDVLPDLHKHLLQYFFRHFMRRNDLADHRKQCF